MSHTNDVRNVVVLAAASDGSATARYEYGPFGEPIRVTGPAAALNPFRFSTKRTDPTIDLVLYEYRIYSPTLGLWPNPDPIGELGFTLLTTGRQRTTETESDGELFTGRRTNPRPNEANLNSFVLNDPQNRIDPIGLISFDGCDAAQQAEITAAWNAGCAKINDPRFACCLKRSGLTQLLKRRCSWGNIKFYCRNNGTFWCNQSTCAHAWRSILPGINAGRITVCYPLAQNCGPLSMPCLLMHELAHVVSASPLESPNSAAISTENCCQSF